MVEATVNSVTSTYTYRGDGLRDSRTVGMTTTTFTGDPSGEGLGLPVVVDDGNQYLYGAGLSAMKQSGQLRSSWWAMRGSNPRPSRCKRDALTN